MSNVSPEAMQRYISTARSRAQQRSLRLQARQARGLQVARAATTILKSELAASRVVVFGSLLSERFHESSDINLAVWDLPEKAYFKAVSQLNALSNFQMDLVEIQYAGPEILAAIAQGREL